MTQEMRITSGSRLRMMAVAASAAMVGFMGTSMAFAQVDSDRGGGDATNAQRSDTGKPSTQRFKESSAGRVGVSDSQITQAVTKRLSRDSAVPDHLIDVSVQGGRVTLSGSVDNLLAKDRAADLARAVRGVTEVNNTIRVRSVQRTDVQIENDIEIAWALDPAADSYEVRASSDDGVVTIHGKADSWQERELAAQVARGVRGVKEVKNSIEVRPMRPRVDGEIEADIRGRLASDVHLSDEDLQVNVQNAVVTLTGTVGSALEKKWAVADSWVIGVKDVDASGLKVEPRWPSKAGNGSQIEAGQAQSNGEVSGSPRAAARSGAEQDRTAVREKAPQKGRSDSDIHSAIHNALQDDPRMAEARTKISVDQGVVTLTGTVNHLKAKRAAEAEAWNVNGVRQVNNQLKVRPEAQVPDSKIESNVRQALLLDPWVERHDLAVTVRNGKVFLAGSVDSQFERNRASDVAARTKGVVAIQNSLRVAPGLGVEAYVPKGFSAGTAAPYPESGPLPAAKSDAEIREDIENEMFWSPFVDADAVSVSVEEGVATLRGTVDDYAERAAATENAKEGGAFRVRNNLSVREDSESGLIEN